MTVLEVRGQNWAWEDSWGTKTLISPLNNIHWISTTLTHPVSPAPPHRRRRSASWPSHHAQQRPHSMHRRAWLPSHNVVCCCCCRLPPCIAHGYRLPVSCVVAAAACPREPLSWVAATVLCCSPCIATPRGATLLLALRRFSSRSCTTARRCCVAIHHGSLLRCHS